MLKKQINQHKKSSKKRHFFVDIKERFWYYIQALNERVSTTKKKLKKVLTVRSLSGKIDKHSQERKHSIFEN